jgi:heat shock protein HslJ
MQLNPTWWWRTVFHLLLVPSFACVALMSTAPAQTQGGAMPELLGTEWLLEDLGGSGVIDNARATLSFPERGKVTGSGSCNNFFASVEIRGDLVNVGTIGATHMQCVDAVSDQEGRYLAALQLADRMSFDGTSLFLHTKSLEKPLRFTRLNKP